MSLKNIQRKHFGYVFIVSVIILIGCNSEYIMKGMSDTYFKGRLNPNIDGYSMFPSRKVSTGKAQPWPIAKCYNNKNLPDDCLAYFKKNKTIAYLVIRNDSICYEQYWDGYSDTSHTNSFSAAKSIVSILAGIAIKEGKIKSIHEKVSDFIPGFNKGMDSLLTIENLLTMSSGIDFNESYLSPWGYPAKAFYGNHLMNLTLHYKVKTTPGKKYHYLSGNSTLLGYVITQATGEKLSSYASEKLWQPLGAENPAYWSLDHKGGMEKAFCCFNSNARDFARLGQLYLDSGKWHGVQIVPKNYVVASTTPKLVPFYGYNWWITHCGKHYVPYAAGLFGQLIYVIPDENMVVVRLGRTNGSDDNKYYISAAIAMYGKEKN